MAALSRLNSVIWDMYISAVILLSKGKTPIQVKQKHGIIERENYNKPKSPGAKGPVDLCPARTGVATETSKQPGTSDMRIKAIEEAMRHFQMI